MTKLKDILVGTVPKNAPKPVYPQPETNHFGNISKHKFAEFSLCDVDGNSINSPIIKALCIDGDKTIESQYQTPFENSNPEQRLPTLMAAIQSGEFARGFGSVASNDSLIGKVANSVMNVSQDLGSMIGVNLADLQGRTNLSKVNTTQVFLSTSSIKVNLTVFFQAYRNALTEVEYQIMQLEAWSLPQYLSKYSITANIAGSEGIFSGLIPPFVEVTLSGKTYKPFVIESVSAPLITPIDSDGNRLNLTANISLLSRTAWDAGDLYKLYGVGAQ